MPPRDVRQKVRHVLEFLAEQYGTPRRRPTPDPLAVLVGTILSQNTNDRNRDVAFDRLVARFSTWDQVAAARAESIAAAIRPGGLGNQKAKFIKSALASLKASFGTYDLSPIAAMPTQQAFETLTALNGVGVKTAAVLLCFAFKRDVFPVDTHVHRVCGRLGLVAEKSTRDQTFDQMKPLVPKGKAYSFHINVIRFGKEICHARNPECWRCPLFKECVWPGKVEAARRRTEA